MAQVSKEKLEEIEGVGTKVAEEVSAWFHREKNQQFLSKLEKVGVTIAAEENKKEQKFKMHWKHKIHQNFEFSKTEKANWQKSWKK